jgi:hypothetical protein
LAKVSPFQYLAACLLVMILRPITFMTVTVTLVVFYHGVLLHAAFLEIRPTLDRAGSDGHPLLRMYRRVAPVLTIGGLLLLLVPNGTVGEQTPGVLVAAGTAFILAVKMISFAGTDAGQPRAS